MRILIPRTNFARLLTCLATTLLLAPVHAVSITLNAAKDTTLYLSPTGSSANGAGENLFVGLTNQGGVRRGLISFDVASHLPAGAVVQQVELKLRMSKTISGDQTIGLHRVATGWGEGASDAAGSEGGGAVAEAGDATWIHAVAPGTLWTTPGGDFLGSASESQSVGAVGDYVWGSTGEMVADVQYWLDNPNQDFGWALIGDEQTAGNAKRFNTRENSDAATRPVLQVTYAIVPEPTTAALFFIAMAACRFRRWTIDAPRIL